MQTPLVAPANYSNPSSSDQQQCTHMPHIANIIDYKLILQQSEITGIIKKKEKITGIKICIRIGNT